MLALLLAVAATLPAAQAPQTPQPFPRSAVAELGTGWRFAVGDSAAWASPGHPDGTWRAVQVPASWSSLGLADLRGFGWYRLRYQIDTAYTEPMGLRFQSVATAYEVFLDGRRIGGFGDFPPGYRPRSGVPATFAVPAAALTRGEHVLAVRVYSDERVGGIDRPVLAGPAESLRAAESVLSACLLGAAFLLLGLAITEAFFWARRPEATEHLAFFGFVVALALLFILWVPSVRAEVSAGMDFYRLHLLFSGVAAAVFAPRR